MASTKAMMALIVLATVIDGMDASIVNVVLPQMSADLGMTVSSSAFVSVAYLIPIAGLCLALGKVADRTDVRRMFVVGTIIFILASVGCALSPGQGALISFRFIQGLGAAFMVASTPIMVVRHLPEDHRGRGMACIAAGSGISVIIGPTIGGIIGDILSWHWVFLLNIPLGIVLLAASGMIPKGFSDASSSLPDRPSVVMMFAGIALGMVAMYGYVDGFLGTVPAIACAAVAVVLMGAVVTRSRRTPDPLLDMRLLGNRRFAAVSAVFLLSTMMGAGVMYLIPYYLTLAEGMDSFDIGVILAVASLLTVIVTVPTGKWCDSRGCRTPACISLLLRVVFSLMLAVIDPALGLGFFVTALAILGVSFGISGTSQSTRMVEEAPEELSGEAGTMAMLVNYVGYALGLAMFALAFSLASSGSGDMGSMPLSDFLGGFHVSCAMGAALAVVALAASLAVKGREKAGVHEE